jgi:hypothetical protein
MVGPLMDEWLETLSLSLAAGKVRATALATGRDHATQAHA